MWASVCVAEEVGEELGSSEILLWGLSR